MSGDADVLTTRVACVPCGWSHSCSRDCDPEASPRSRSELHRDVEGKARAALRHHIEGAHRRAVR